jgi:hypothetical protein
MREINKIINTLSIIDADLKKLIYQKVKIPNLDDYNSLSDYWYPRPPCFIPLFLGSGASHKGVVNHFFCDRKPTFAKYSLEKGLITEIARNSKPWITLIVPELITLKEA